MPRHVHVAEDLSARQLDVLELVIDNAVHGWPFPTVREIGEALGIDSTNCAQGHLNALERKGWVEQRQKATSRGRRLTNKARRYFGLPLLPLAVRRAA